MARNNLAGAPVVVGVAGSGSSRSAVQLAAQHAALRNRPLLILHAIEADLGPDTAGNLADDDVADAISVAREVAPTVEIRTEVTTSAPGAGLVAASERAAIVVVGTDGRGSASGVLTGSTAIQVATHSACPVIVSRGQAAAGGEVILGVDGSPESASAVAFAFETASLTDATLNAIHAWHHPIISPPGETLPILYTDVDVRNLESRLLAEAVSGWGDKYSDVALEKTLIRGGAVRALIEASSNAALLVVGARGRGGFAGLLLGSVGLTLMHRSPCPLAIVRPGVQTL